MKKTNITYLATYASVLLYGLFVTIILLNGTVPGLDGIIESRRFKEDLETARIMTHHLSEPTVEGISLDSAYAVQSYLRSMMGESVSFVPQAADTGFFYDTQSQTVSALRYSDISKKIDWTEPMSLLPEQVPGTAYLLLTWTGSPVADAVGHIYNQPTRGMPVEPAVASWTQEWLSRASARLKANNPDASLETWVYQLHNHFSPYYTLFACNEFWSTLATDGAMIEAVVFCPGIRVIPTFRLSGFKAASIQLDSLVLPDTVRFIEQGAFSDRFAITQLEITSDRRMTIEPNALVGIEQISFLTDILERDHPLFQLESYLDGAPLVSYDANHPTGTPNFNLVRLKDYLASQGLDVIAFNIEMNLYDTSRSKIYIFTTEGYHGYVEPRPE